MISSFNGRFLRPGRHLLFWLAFLVYRLTTTTLNNSLIGDYWWGDWKVLTVLCVEVCFKALFAYGLVYFLVPRWLETKRYWEFGLASLCWFYLVCGLYASFHYYVVEKAITVFMYLKDGVNTSVTERMTSPEFLLAFLPQFLFPATIMGAISFFRKKSRLAKIEEERNRMELWALKNQLNPHFLFNTLNNLYSFVMDNSPKAPDMILRLSDTLEYVLYHSQQKEVTLRQELAAIEHFMALEQIHYGERLTVQYTKEGDLDILISPLLLLSLVENAFKHSASGDVDQPVIKIKFCGEVATVRCHIWNTKSQYQGELSDDYKEGIGLSNIQRQLDLVYPNRYELVINDQPDFFDLSLRLNT
ncbi:MAG: sensor histidine kinase [Bacteroidota bacterium]